MHRKSLNHRHVCVFPFRRSCDSRYLPLLIHFTQDQGRVATPNILIVEPYPKPSQKEEVPNKLDSDEDIPEV